MGSATACVVGMTMGARKRAAQREYLPERTPEGARAEARARYRIGERLRPCRGCRGCTLAIVKDDGQIVEVWQGVEHPHLAVCGGSGLLPAKKSRSRRRLDASHVLAVLDRAEMERADAERLVATCGDDLALVRAIAWIAECDGRIVDTERRLASGWTIPERRDGFSDEDLLATYLDHTPPSRTTP